MLNNILSKLGFKRCPTCKTLFRSRTNHQRDPLCNAMKFAAHMDAERDAVLDDLEAQANAIAMMLKVAKE